MQRTSEISNIFDGETIFTRFMKIYEQLSMHRKDLLLCLRQEVVANTNEQAILFFNGECIPPEFARAQKFPVRFDDTVYGTLLISSKESVTALKNSTALTIAALCGSILHTYELSWFVQEYIHRNVPVQEGGSIPRPQLTKRQFEVLRLICKGYTKQEIMQEFHITDSTLQKHRQAIYNSLHVKSESEVLAVALQLRLFSPLDLLTNTI